MTFQQILTQCYQILDYPYGVATTYQATRLLGLLNRRYHQLLQEVGSKIRDSRITFTTVAQQQIYSMPPIVDQVRDIYDPLTNMRKLLMKDVQWIRTIDPRAEVTSFGSPGVWANYGIRAIQKDIATANSGGGAIFAVSSSNTDTANVSIVYTRNNGYRGSDKTALTGNTALQISTANDVIEVTSFYLDSPCNGFVYLQDASANANVISTLEPGQTFARFQSILLYPTPQSSNLVLYMDIVRVIPDTIANVNEEPLIPSDFHWILTTPVLMDEFLKLKDPRYDLMAAEWKQSITELEMFILNNPDWIIIPNGPRPGWYPLRFPATWPDQTPAG